MIIFPAFARVIYDLVPEISGGGSSILLDIRGIHEDGWKAVSLPSTLSYAKIIKQSFVSLKENFYTR